MHRTHNMRYINGERTLTCRSGLFLSELYTVSFLSALNDRIFRDKRPDLSPDELDAALPIFSE